jgi:GT2 family glycosyltransferase
MAREVNGRTVVNGHGQWECRNRAAAQGFAPFILFLDGDVVLTPSAWPTLLGAMAHEEVGIATGLLLWDEGLAPREMPLASCIKFAGYAFGLRRLPYARFVGWLPDNPKVYPRSDLQAVSAAFMLTRRPLWRSLEGFATDYGSRPLADVDFCVRARSQGPVIAFEPAALALAGLEPLADDMILLQQGGAILDARLGPHRLYDEHILL